MDFIKSNYFMIALFIYIVFSILMNHSALRGIFSFEKGFKGESPEDTKERKYRNKLIFFSNVSIFINGMATWWILSLYMSLKKDEDYEDIDNKKLSIVYPIFGFTNWILKIYGKKVYLIENKDGYEIKYLLNGFVEYYKNNVLHRECVVNKKEREQSKVYPAIFRRNAQNILYNSDSRWYCHGEKIHSCSYEHFNKKRIRKNVADF